MTLIFRLSKGQDEGKQNTNANVDKRQNSWAISDLHVWSLPHPPQLPTCESVNGACQGRQGELHAGKSILRQNPTTTPTTNMKQQLFERNIPFFGFIQLAFECLFEGKETQHT